MGGVKEAPKRRTYCRQPCYSPRAIGHYMPKVSFPWTRITYQERGFPVVNGTGRIKW